MHLFYLFVYTLFLSFTLATVLPTLHLLYFAPFIVFCYYHRSLPICMWWSFLSGLVVDLLSANTPIGNFAINYCITTMLLYRFQFHFFEDRLSTFPVMTFGFISLSTIIQVLIFYVIGRPIALNWQWLSDDLILTSFQGSFYALLAFTLPSIFLSALKRRYLLFRLSRR